MQNTGERGNFKKRDKEVNNKIYENYKKLILAKI